MNHSFLFTDIFPAPHGALTAEEQCGPPSVPICNMLGHFYNFNLDECFVWQKRNLIPHDSKQFIIYFIQMPMPTYFKFGNDVVDAINNNPKCYLLLPSMLERVISPDDLALALKKKGIKHDKVIVLCSDKVSHNKRINDVLYLYVEFWESYTRYHQRFINSSSELDFETRKATIMQANKKFLCLNRNIKSHRIWFYYLLQKHGMVDQGHVSYHLPKINKQEYVTIARDYNTIKYIPADLQEEYKKDVVRKLLPKSLDRLNDKWIINYNQSIKPYYIDSLLSIVTESDFRTPFITEKTYKAIVHCHPFFILGDKSHHEILHSMGYVTFEKLFGINEVMNWSDAVKLLDNIKNMSIEEIKSKVIEMMPMVEHNYKNFYSRKTDWLDIKALLEKVTNV